MQTSMSLSAVAVPLANEPKTLALDILIPARRTASTNVCAFFKASLIGFFSIHQEVCHRLSSISVHTHVLLFCRNASCNRRTWLQYCKWKSLQVAASSLRILKEMIFPLVLLDHGWVGAVRSSFLHRLLSVFF